MAWDTNRQEGDVLTAQDWNQAVQEIKSKQSRLNVVDGLDSTSSVDVLSAKQGKVLNDRITDVNTAVENVSDKIDKLPTGIYYGQYGSEEDLEDVQVTAKGYAYIASTDPAVYYIYLYDNGTWTNSGNKFVTTELETSLSSKSQTKAPTTKIVAEGIEAIDVTSARSAEDENELTAAQKYNASANINDRVADVVVATGEVKALGYKVLNPNASFASQVTAANTVYEIREELEVTGSATIPANCTLKFNGGAVRGSGSLTLANTKLEGNITFGRELHVSGKATNDIINVAWFGAVGDGVTDDSNALKNAIAVLKQKNSTLIFGDGKTYLHGDGIADLTNDPDMTLHTGYSYPRASQDDSTAGYLHPSGPAAIGRDIVLRFLGFDGLTIEGNGSTIVSNPNNGICMHNSIFFFGACANMVVRNLNVNGNRTLRVANAEAQFNDWSTGSYPTYPNGIIPSWLEQVWLESAASDASQKGYNLVSNIHVAACHDMIFEDIVSTDAMMDDLMVNKTGNGSLEGCYNISVIKSTFTYAARAGFDVGQGRNIVVSECHFEHNGYYTNGTLDTIGSGNHGGFSAEMESNPASHGKITFHITDTSFENNDEAHVKFSSGVHNSIVERCTFGQGGIRFSRVLKDNNAEWSYSEDNMLKECSLLNCSLGIVQSGATITGNVFKFDKDFQKDYSYDSGTTNWSPYFLNSNVSNIVINNPIVFEDNIVEVDVTGLTKEIDGTVYIDVTKAKGQGRLRITGDDKNVVRNNVFKNVSPTSKSYEGFPGQSGSYFYIVTLKGVVEKNSIINDYPICYISNDEEKTDGISRIELVHNYTIYNEKNVVDSNNDIVGGIANTPNIADKGTISGRPNLITVLGVGASKMEFFNYRNISSGSNEVFLLKNIGQETIVTITSSGLKNQFKNNTYTAGELKYFLISQFPRANKPKMYFTKNTGAPEFELERYYSKSGETFNVLTSKPTDWELAFYIKYYELIDGEHVLISGTAIEDALTDAIEVPFTYTDLITTANNKAEAYFQIPDASVYPYILCQKNGDYSTATSYKIADAVSYWTAEDGYAAIERKGSVRPTGMHKDNGNIVGELLPNDVGLCFYDTNIKKPIYVDSVNNTTGVVVWVDANGEPAGLQVSDTTILIGAAAGTKDVSVYYSGATAPTITVLNSDDTANTWLTATYTLYAPTFVANTYYSAANTKVATKPSNWETNYMNYYTDAEATIPVAGVPKNEVVLTAGANNTSAPRGAKILVTLDDELVIINVVQSY